MELFTINRYDDQFLTNSTAIDQNQEDTNLQKLLKKAEKRKRKFQKLEDHKESIDKENLLDKITNNDSECPKINADKLKVTDADEPIETAAEEAEKSLDFQVLGSEVFEKKLRVDVVLPPWLAHPTLIATNINKGDDEEKEPITDLTYLSNEIKSSLKNMNIDELFPVQKAVIPWLFKAYSKPSPFRPRDICVSAPTGSGKTLAFAIPIVQMLTNRVEKKVRALIVLPVNELALQVFKVFKKLSEKTDLTVCLLSKSFQFSVEQQKLVEEFKGKYYSKADIVVTTPGRLVEHIHSTKGFCLNNLKFLVIDEADRIMDQVHQNWLYHLDNHVKNTSDTLLSGHVAPLTINELTRSATTQPHKLLFSATLSQDPEKLQQLRLFHPKLFTSVIANLEELAAKFSSNQLESNDGKSQVRGDFIGKYTTPSELSEKYCLTEASLKPLTLFSLIESNSWNKFLCFTNSAESTHRLVFVLKELLKDKNVSELSASLKPKARMQTLSSFVRGKINGLICSDALARGIDLPDVDIVISYDAPRHVKTYIHRIGRTARAGRQGTAITLLTENELVSFNVLLNEVGKSLRDEIKSDTTIEELHAKTYSTALFNLRKSLEEEKRMKLRSKTLARERAKPLNTEKLSIMEKLQAQAKDGLMIGLEVEDETKFSKDIKIKKNKKIKKSKVKGELPPSIVHET